MRGWHKTLVAGLSVTALLAVWQVAGAAKAPFVSQPSRVVTAGIEIVRSGSFVRDLGISFSEFALGFGLAVAAGIPLGLLLGTFSRLRLFADPPLLALYATPYLALLPILVVWLGIGLASKIAAVFIGGLFPILLNSMAGVRQVDRSWVLAAQSLCATRGAVFRKVILPAALPSILAGLRLGLSRSVLAMVVAEMYVSQAGIGNQIMRVGSAFRMDALLFYVLLVSAFGFAATRVVSYLEQRLWAPGK